MAKKQAWFRITFLLMALAGFCLIALRSFYVPFSHDEVATFLFYIQPGKFIPFFAHPDANGHFLTNLSGWISFKLFGSSPFALRIPNLLAFVVMCYGLWKISALFRNTRSAFFFSSAFLLSWNFLAYFALCRGYGLSMAFLIPGFYFFLSYLKSSRFSDFLKFVLCSQIALSANLTLVAVLGVLSGLLVLHLVIRKVRPDWKTILVFLIHFALIYYWVQYGLYLKEAGALYYGAGESYWQVSFVSLIETLFFKSALLNYFVLALSAFLVISFVFNAISKGKDWLTNSPFAISFLVLSFLVLGFFLLKLVLGVNYPEDRTGLFFYVFFISTLCFQLDELAGKWNTIGVVIPVLYFLQALSLYNLSYHPWRVYETMPQHFFTRLIEEQKKSNSKITIAGHRVREFFYGFLNYNSSVKLNHMTSPEALQMNCDYALAYQQDAAWYSNYYEEIEKEEQWGFRLLKRKIALKKNLISEQQKYPLFQGKFLYSNLYEVRDTTFAEDYPLQADLKFSIGKTQVPLNLYLVMEIESEDPRESKSFIRVPLNLIRYDWNGIQQQELSLVSGNLPKKIKRLVIYLWNIDEAETQFQTHSFKLYQLHGPGVKEISKAAI